MKVITECNEENQPKDKYVQDFLQGKLFMKTLDQFNYILSDVCSSKNNFRGDMLEGFSESYNEWYNPHHYTIENNEIIKSGSVGAIDVLTLRRKVFCCTALDYFDEINAIMKPSEELKAFGQYAVIITDVQKFIDRIQKAFNKICKEDKAAYTLDYNRVLYDLNNKENIVFSEFHKSHSYSWQNEFRISMDFTEGKFSQKILNEVTDHAKLTFPGKIEIDNNPLSLSNSMYFEIGDIHDICECYDINDYFNSEDIQLKEKPSFIKKEEFKRIPRPTFCKELAVVPLSDGKFHLGITKDSIFSTIL